MRANALKRTLAGGGQALNAWCSIASAHVAELAKFIAFLEEAEHFKVTT